MRDPPCRCRQDRAVLPHDALGERRRRRPQPPAADDGGVRAAEAGRGRQPRPELPAESRKQDCERNAAQRWLPDHSEELRPCRPVFLGDDLYCCQSVCRAVLDAEADFIFVAKPNSHKRLHELLHDQFIHSQPWLHRRNRKRNFGHGSNGLANLLATLNLFAFALHGVLDCACELWRQCRDPAHLLRGTTGLHKVLLLSARAGVVRDAAQATPAAGLAPREGLRVHVTRRTAATTSLAAPSVLPSRPPNHFGALSATYQTRQNENRCDSAHSLDVSMT